MVTSIPGTIMLMLVTKVERHHQYGKSLQQPQNRWCLVTWWPSPEATTHKLQIKLTTRVQPLTPSMKTFEDKAEL